MNENSTPVPVSAPVQQVHWGALIMGLFLLVSAALLITTAPLFGILGLSTMEGVDSDQALGLVMLALGVLALGLLLVPGIYLNARKFFNAPEAAFRLPVLPTLPILSLLGFLWGAVLLIGHVVTKYHTLSIVLLPVINVFALLLPIVIVLFVALNKLPIPSARRAWSVFGASAIISPLITIVLELIAFAAILGLIFLYASSTPGLDTTLNTIISAVKNGQPALDFMSQDIAALLLAPGTAFALLGLFSLLVPMIEEGFKITVLWFYADRLQRPVDGFVLGALCGAAFALAENIGFVSSGAADWTVNIVTRASATLPHIFNCALMGWALAVAWQKRNYARLLITYLAVILVHGTWNALSIALAFSSLNSFIADIPAIIATPVPAAITWVVLIIGLFGGLFFANKQMRKLVASEMEENVGYNPSLLSQKSGENDGTVENPD